MVDIYGKDMKQYKVTADDNGTTVCNTYYAASEAEAFCAFVADYPCCVVQSIDEV